VARHNDTYGLGGTAREVRAGYEEAMARLAKEPADGKVGPRHLQAAMPRTGHYDDHWPYHARALSAYLKGAPAPLGAGAGLSGDGGGGRERAGGASRGEVQRRALAGGL